MAIIFLNISIWLIDTVTEPLGQSEPGWNGNEWCTFFLSLSRGIILWIELPWPENPANTYMQHKETLDSCFDLIRSHQHTVISTTGDWTSDHRLQSQNSTTEPPIHITHKWRQIKGYSTFLGSPELESHHQMLFSVIHLTPQFFAGFFSLVIQQVYS